MVRRKETRTAKSVKREGRARSGLRSIKERRLLAFICLGPRIAVF